MDVSLDQHEQALVEKADHYERLADRLRALAWDHYTARHGVAHLLVSTFATPDAPPVWLN